MKEKFLTGLLAAQLLTAGLACPALAAPPTPDVVVHDANLATSLDLQRTQNDFERARLERQLEDDKAARAQGKLTGGEAGSEQGEAAELTVELRRVETDPSTVLTDAELAAIEAPYLGREVKVGELYALTKEINELYSKKGYMTCRAFLQAQTIQDGTVHITLIEGRTGDISIAGTKHTRERYILNRLHLHSGEVTNTEQLNRDLLYFNGTNDMQLRIVVGAGQAPGTTDYQLQAYEPKKHNFTFFGDNNGSTVTGKWRMGAYYTAKSLTGVRDSLSLGLIHSLGTDAASAFYSRPLGRSGTKLNLSYSTNGVEQRYNANGGSLPGYHTEGHANSYAVGITQPLLVNERVRAELSLDLNRQQSASDFLYGSSGRLNIVDDTVNDVALGYALTTFSPQTVFYQKHSIVTGRSKSAPRDGNYRSQNYTLYRFNSLFQRSLKQRYLWTVRGELQLSSHDNLQSSRQFFFGGSNTVRGYRENYMGGDGGFLLSTELQRAISKDRKIQGFVFSDYAHTIGENAASANIEKALFSMGFGVKAELQRGVSANLTFGFPLFRNMRGMNETVSPCRVNLVVLGQI